MFEWLKRKGNRSSELGLARKGDSFVLARAGRFKENASRSEVYVARTGSILPGEGTFYDPISLSNFVDLEKTKLTASISKSFRSNVLSKLLDVDLPAKLSLGGRVGHLWLDGFKMDPVAKAALSVRLLDLGASDSRQGGFLRFKAGRDTTGYAGHGFEIDRRISVLSLPSTTLYGNVQYKTNNRNVGVWKTSSSFGLHQDFRIAGLRFAARVGMTPEGEYVYDLRL